jgi:kinesin family protein 6/9
MGKTNVRVVVRARPTASYAAQNFEFNEASDSIDMRLPKDETAGFVNNQQESWHFKLDRVLSNASQEQVFECCAQDVVRSVMEGYNGTILAYGQTGAGKTHTMTGGHVGFADRGIVPRAISLIFAEAAARPESAITVRLSYVEIYNELMFDLLKDVGVSEQSGDLAIVEDSRGNIQVKGLSAPAAGTEEEALHVFFQGDTNRHVAEHALNKGSTRSHVVFTIHVESRSRVESSEKVIYSKLHLVDLAGSERVKKTGSDGVILNEATHINKSLTFLEQVVIALGNKNRDHVPYRQSKLTHLIKDSLGGNCKTTMIANVWPEAKMLQETASTLRFATRMMRVSNEATVNVHLDPAMLIRKYERQIKDLKQELAMHDTLAGRSRVQYEEYAPHEAKELEEKVKMYLEGELQEIEVSSLRMVYEAFSCFRKLYQQLGTELASRPVRPRPGEGAGQAAEGAQAAHQEPEGAREGEVGEDEEGRGISVGVAPADSRPPGEDRPAALAGEQGDAGEAGYPGTMPRQRSGGGDREEPRPDKQAAFADWKGHEGQVFEEDFEKNRAELREKRAEMREALNMANTKKRDIDEAKERLGRKQADKAMDPNGRDEELIDEEEYALIKSLKDTKQQYRDAFELHRRVKTEVLQIERSMQQCKVRLVQAFEEWYDQKYGQVPKEAPAERQGDRFDSQEMFDLMEADRLETQHPDALAYHNARKNAARDVRQKRAVPQRAGR